MSDYIKRDDALNIDFKIRVGAFENRKTTAINAVQAYADAIAKIPSEDVRPVVLCRDCVNYVESDEANGEKMCVIDAKWCVEDGCYYGFTAYTPQDWFCAGGKKREES